MRLEDCVPPELQAEGEKLIRTLGFTETIMETWIAVLIDRVTNPNTRRP